jgi:hypothetical protein
MPQPNHLYFYPNEVAKPRRNTRLNALQLHAPATRAGLLPASVASPTGRGVRRHQALRTCRLRVRVHGLRQPACLVWWKPQCQRCSTTVLEAGETHAMQANKPVSAWQAAFGADAPVACAATWSNADHAPLVGVEWRR